MARANLNVEDLVIEQFLAAQESKTVRLLTVRIAEESMVFHSSQDKQGTADQDFESLLPTTFLSNEACFGLFNLTDDASSNQQWAMLVWIPEECRVRDKMLYSSSRDDLKKRLGLGYFKTDYAANVYSDLTWEAFGASQCREVGLEALTDTERLILDEKAASSSESHATKATALSVLPFATSPEAAEALAALQAGEVNWVELAVTDEVIQLRSSQIAPEGSSYASLLSDDHAVFVAARLDGKGLFLFVCPEGVPVRVKMTMSSSKASVLAAATQIGVVFDKSIEVRGLEDLDDAIAAELRPVAADDTSSSSSGATLSHAKPARPGRGKAKVGKFQA